jgi:hypothetical protein
MSTTGLVRRVVNWDVDEVVQEPEISTPVLPTPVQNIAADMRSAIRDAMTQLNGEALNNNEVTVTRPKITRTRTGNGHKKLFFRKLNNPEKDLIRAQFIRVNGQIAEDDCVRLKSQMDSVVAIFQITGFVSYLHREVAQGRLALSSVGAYAAWMETRYPNLWAQWNKPAFRSTRDVNRNNRRAGRPMVNIPIEQSPITPQFIPSSTPTFKAFNRRGSLFRGN